MRRFVCVVLALGAVLVLAGCSGRTTGTTGITEISATLHATGSCDKGQTCTWYWEYWFASQPRSASRKTPVQGPVSGPTGDVKLSARITGLTPGAAYRWVFCASPNNGGVYVCSGPNGTFGSATADPPPDYATFTALPQRTLAARWDGTVWTIQPTPNPAGAQNGSFLNSVSCTSATACTAVGYDQNSAGTIMTLAEAWGGTTWTIQPTPNPAGAQPALRAVSCTSATACTAVGNYFNSAGNPVTLAERWDGTAWTIQPLPNPGIDGSLYGVSCTSTTACTAVGQDQNSAGSLVTLAEAWDGTTWTVQPTPNPGTYQNGPLIGVSCRSACTAVGLDFNIVGGVAVGATLAERWDGTSWTVQPTLNPGDGPGPSMEGVSCPSGTACTAVGLGYGPHAAVPLAEHWDGATWTVQPTPNPAGAQLGSSLSGVSCTSATACTAVGSHENSAIERRTLAERWDGTTWRIQTSPNPTGGNLNELFGVSCTSDTACTAVGGH